MTDELYLSQRQLRGVEGINVILNEFSVWLSKAEFGKEKGHTRQCIDRGQTKAWRPLLIATRLTNDVHSHMPSPQIEANL